MELKGSKTEKNLMDAFAGESMARNKYIRHFAGRIAALRRRRNARMHFAAQSRLG